MNELLNDITEWGKLLLTEKETANALGVDYAEFIANNEYTEAYKTGRLLTISAHKKKVITLANQGSGPAQTHLEKLRKEQEIEQLRNGWT